MAADSSSLNAGVGGFGGSCFFGVSAGDKPTGSLSWRVNVPRKLTDSSGGAGLLQLTYATKGVLAQRLQFAELGAPVREPAVADVDATAALAGPNRDRVSRGSRYIAARLAMVREAIQDGQLKPTKVSGKGRRADGCTKPLTGEAFRAFAAENLRLDVSDLVAPGPTRAAGGSYRNGGYGGDYSARPGDESGGSHVGKSGGSHVGNRGTGASKPQG